MLFGELKKLVRLAFVKLLQVPSFYFDVTLTDITIPCAYFAVLVIQNHKWN